MLYIVYENKKFNLQIKYTFKLLLSTFNIEYKFFNYEELNSRELSKQIPFISYGKRKPKFSSNYHIHIYESCLFGREYLKLESMPREPIDWYKDIPIIYKGEGNINKWVEYYKEDNVNSIETNIDIIASSFFMVSRYEEVVNPVEDKYERFPAYASLAYRQNFLNIPVVNAYIELLGSWIKSIDSRINMKKLWKGAGFAVCLTHDIDELRKYRLRPPIRHLYLTLRERKIGKFFALLCDYLNSKIRGDPYDKFDYLMDLSDRYGFGSSYYFMCRGENKFEKYYDVCNNRVIRLLRKIRDRDFEIGLHSSLNAYCDTRILTAEKDKIEKSLGSKIFGVRQHYILWKTPESWLTHEQAGFKYDDTLYFPNYEGFRGGICFPYKPFDILRNRTLNIWEVPITVMECSLFLHQALSPSQVLKRTKSMIDTVSKYQGLFVLLWHNSSLNDYKYPGAKDVYESILKYLNDLNVFKGSVWDIIQEWESSLGILSDT